MHHANGNPCQCKQKWSASPTAYVRSHPNKRGSDGQTFNDSISQAIARRA